MAKSLRR